jgi:cyclopropane fatty-acyl-phospholipid synthase-like methyltransferase
MSYFDEKKNVEGYIQLAQGYDGRDLIEMLKKFLPEGSTVLELGMGPGVDLDLLQKSYQATGSDRSQVFLDLYQEKHPATELLLLDAVTIETERTYDALYSNKVLIHLSLEEMEQSFARQAAILNPGGLALHSFWAGDHEETHQGLRFLYLQEEQLQKLVAPYFNVEKIGRYTELEDDDSIVIVLRKLD